MNLHRAILVALRERLSLPRDRRGATIAELAARLDVSSYIVAAAVSSLSGEGLVNSVRSPGEVRYALSPMARAIASAAVSTE